MSPTCGVKMPIVAPAGVAPEVTTLKEMLSGNEAIALGAELAGVGLAAAYPGTPSTEILETIAHRGKIYAEWTPNEKVALDVAVGAAYVGRRSLAAMKHVGLNVAADSLFYASYTGLAAGLVVVSADDPGMHSSQNEQDNRRYGPFARVPVLEPADSEEAKNFVGAAIALSEIYDTPVVLRTTTRISHSKSPVETGKLLVGPEFAAVHLPGRSGPQPAGGEQGNGIVFKRQPEKYVMIPAFARRRHPVIEDRIRRLALYAETSSLNFLEMNSPELGVIAAGVAYQHAREVFREASFLKLGLSYPLPLQTIATFAGRVKRLVVVEELDPFLEEQIRAMGIEVVGKDVFPLEGELDPQTVRRCAVDAGLILATSEPGVRRFQSVPSGENAGTVEPASTTQAESMEPESLPGRPPVLCPGCGHRGVFYALKKMKAVVFGDIGCYTLGVVPPLSSMDTCGCMGASVGVLHGATRAGLEGPAVAVIGDSTFLHSGIAPLANIVYNRGTGLTIIVDNSITAMTGHQDNPASGRTLMGEPAPAVDLEALVRALGIEQVAVIEAYDYLKIMKTCREFLRSKKPGVIIARYPCVLYTREQHEIPVVKQDLCTDCGICLRIGCPPLNQADGYVVIDPPQCNGCGLCIEVCPFNAIVVGAGRSRGEVGGQ